MLVNFEIRRHDRLGPKSAAISGIFTYDSSRCRSRYRTFVRPDRVSGLHREQSWGRHQCVGLHNRGREFWALVAALRGTLPGVFGVPAGMGDTLTGLFAVPAAIAVATGSAQQGRRAAIVWNILGLADFAVAITLGAITSPGPFQLVVPDVPSIGAGAYPGVLTPAFVVPNSILLHGLSLRQLRRRSRLEEARR